MDAARDFFMQGAEKDIYVQFLTNTNRPNALKRLLYSCEEGVFRDGTLEPLKCFKNRQHRFGVIMADFKCEIEEPAQASRIYQRLKNGEFGKLSADEDAYASYGISWTCWYQAAAGHSDEGREKARNLIKETVDSPTFANTPMMPKILVMYGNMHYAEHTAKHYEAASAAYWRLAKQYPKSSEAETALYILGKIGLGSKATEKQVKDADAAFAQLLKKYPNTQYCELAKKYSVEVKTKLKK